MKSVLRNILSTKNLLQMVAAILLSYSSCSMADNKFVLDSKYATQWIKITSQFISNDYHFNTNVDNLEEATISCGDQCEIVKLSSTPYSSNGTLNIRIKNNCTRTTVQLPFYIEDGYLVTPLKTYHSTIGSEYCGFHYVDVIVSGDSHQNTGYQVNLNLIK